jgi:hypothetical protein
MGADEIGWKVVEGVVGEGLGVVTKWPPSRAEKLAWGILQMGPIEGR